MQALAKDQLGHSLRIYEGPSAAVLVCTKCGSWADSMARHLWEPCVGTGGRTAAGTSALRAFMAMQHPTGKGVLQVGRDFIAALAEMEADLIEDEHLHL